MLALGLGLLLLPRTSKTTAAAAAEAAAPAVSAGVGDPLDASGIPLDTEAERIAALLRGVRGVGRAEVLLSREGAVVVCTGADSPQVQLDVTNAVSAYTGLGSDKIRILKMKQED